MIIVMASCTKEGPQGPAGEDGTVNCVKCHDDSQEIFAKTNQWAASVHATGGNFERNGASCAPCHTSQGFIEVLQNGGMATATDISNPNPPNCYTCHNIHKTYTTDDWELTNTDPVEFWINAEESDQGTGNMCIGCHQPRVPNPALDATNGSGTVTISSPYWGPHYGTQGAMFAGTAGYEVGTGYDNSFHAKNIENSCVDCHMAEAYGIQAGGHQMGMTYEYHGSEAIYQAGCTDCHTDASALETKIENTDIEISGLIDSLETILIAQGYLDANSHRIVPGTYTNDEAGAVYNYIFVAKDHSSGIHNYKYAKKLLENSIAAVK
jgi:nitrate/TMAO reductase-like tetraheme cytochrome c subunit